MIALCSFENILIFFLSQTLLIVEIKFSIRISMRLF